MARDQVLDHDYDGIREYDNKLPNWWLYTLYGAIIVAIGYWLYYHTFAVGKLPRERLQLAQIAAAEAQLAKLGDSEVTNESLMLMTEIPATVEAGHRVFEQFCVTCHNPNAEGNVGPNLTDAYWLHGGAPMDIYHTVVNGVPDKGMASWIGQLGPVRVRNVVAYVLTLRNTNVPGKEPQGELWVEGQEAGVPPGTDASNGAPDTGAASGTPDPGGSDAVPRESTP